VKQSQRKMLNSLLDLWEAKIVPRITLIRGIGAIFGTIVVDAPKKVRKQASKDTGRSLGGCTERLVAA